MCENSGINTSSRRKRNNIELPMVKRNLLYIFVGRYWYMVNHCFFGYNLKVV